MPPTILILALVASVVASFLAVLAWQIRKRNLHCWLPSFLWQSAHRRFSRPRATSDQPVHLLLCIADHYEPKWGGAPAETADARVAAWVSDYPRLLGSFRDSDGRPPRHTFFYPIDQYEPRHVDSLAGLCRAGFGEVEIHLHHDHDTAENLEKTLRQFTQLLADRHGLLGRWADGRVAYGFVHGNWALDNARSDGRWCGVNNELDVLHTTGCYADFTLPSAPDATQTHKLNSIYYAVGQPRCRKSHNRGNDVGAATPHPRGLMVIQGPLRLWWPKGTWMPRIENGCIQASQPPTAERLDQWLRAEVIVQSRPNWLFVKLHTHGASESNQRVLLGEPMVALHRALASRARLDPLFHYHYVTAREMYNLAKAAESGYSGPIINVIDFAVKP